MGLDSFLAMREDRFNWGEEQGGNSGLEVDSDQDEENLIIGRRMSFGG